MADTNAQNTVTGGGTAAPLVAQTGNSVLDGILNLTRVTASVVGTGLDVWDSVEERKLAREIAKQNATREPAQAQTITGSTSAADYLSNPTVQSSLWGVAGILGALGAGILIWKKVLN